MQSISTPSNKGSSLFLAAYLICLKVARLYIFLVKISFGCEISISLKCMKQWATFCFEHACKDIFWLWSTHFYYLSNTWPLHFPIHCNFFGNFLLYQLGQKIYLDSTKQSISTWPTLQAASTISAPRLNGTILIHLITLGISIRPRKGSLLP